MDNNNTAATAHTPTTYVIRPYFNAHHWQVWFATEDGAWGAKSGPVKTLAEAIGEARHHAVEGYDRIFIRKRISVGRNAGAWHRVALVDPNEPELDDGRPDPEACPGCGCVPGDGITDGCHDPDGCGFHQQAG